jgi:hypothetical protein
MVVQFARAACVLLAASPFLRFTVMLAYWKCSLADARNLMLVADSLPSEVRDALSPEHRASPPCGCESIPTVLIERSGYGARQPVHWMRPRICFYSWIMGHSVANSALAARQQLTCSVVTIHPAWS